MDKLTQTYCNEESRHYTSCINMHGCIRNNSIYNLHILKHHKMKYIVIRNFLSIDDCEKLISSFKETSKPFELNLKDGKDLGNTVYTSTRSKNLSYKYVKNNDSERISNSVKKRLESMLNVGFNGSINDICLPMFCYGEGGEIKAHRGVQKESDNQKYQTFVAVCQLTQRGEDFNGGRFYVNSKATATVDGKTVFNDLEKDRFYPMLNKGDVCIIYNPIVVHGVDTVRMSDKNSAFRLTCSWRSNFDQ